MIAAPFKDALLKAVAASAVVLNYDDKDDFARLWASAKNGAPEILSNAQGKIAIIIVWEGRARTQIGSAEKLLEPHLTPLDWALAFSNVIVQKGADIAGFQIHIVDLTGRRFQGAWAIRMRHQLLAEMPWVSLHAPLIPAGEVPSYREGYRPILEGMGLLNQNAGIWELVQQGRSLSVSVSQGRGTGLEDLAKQWVASVAQSNDHHDINNVIGPDILAKPERRRDGLFGALLTKLEWNGRDLKASSAWKEWAADSRIKQDLFDRGLSAYAVDDQLHHGWARFLCRLFNREAFDEASLDKFDGKTFTKLNPENRAEQKIKLFGCQSPLPLIEFLRKRAIFDRRDYLNQIGGGSPRPEFIFLDLRLYASVQQARQQGRQLADIARNRLRGGLAWEVIPHDEIQRILEWCDGKLDAPRIADEALLLLPRLLALALPLTPIIMFSSTGQAWIKDRLKPYQNIVTGFEKPRVLSDPASIEASIIALREGLDKAVAMARLRLQLAHAQSAIDVATSRRPRDDQRLTNHHIEIYADETRDLGDGITSGLAVCVFPDMAAAETLQNQLLVEHGQCGTVWVGIHGGARPPSLSKGSVISKNEIECERQAQLLANLLTSPPGGLAARDRALWSGIATRVSPAVAPVVGPVSVAAFPDGPLDDALRFNLEFVLYGLIPYFSRGKGFEGTIQVHLPTRRVPYPDRAFAEELCNAFDLGAPGQRGLEWMVSTSTLTGRVGSAFPLVRGWLHEWGDRTGIANQIRKIKMAMLGPKNITAEQAMGRRLLHDVADWVCTASSRLHDRINDQWVWPLKMELVKKELFPKWFISTDGEIRSHYPSRAYWFEADTRNALMLMNSLKASLRGSLRSRTGTDAVRLVLRNSYVENCNDRLRSNEYCEQQRILLWTLRPALHGASGESLHALLLDLQSPT